MPSAVLSLEAERNFALGLFYQENFTKVEGW
jgi:hypothetical protein